MSARFLKYGPIDYKPVSNVVTGAVIAIGGLVGVAHEPIAANTLGALEIGRYPQYEIDLASGKSFSFGDPVYIASSEATDTGTFFGYAIADSAGGKVNAALLQAPPADES
jgi:hypothetical protein